MHPILLAYDGSEPAKHAAARAADLALHQKASVAVLVVGEMMESGYGTVLPVVEPEVYDGVAAEAVELMKQAGVEAEPLVAWGRPAEKIVEVAAEQGAGIVVMGHRGSGGLKSFLLGSVAKHVIDHVPCSVLVVR